MDLSVIYLVIFSCFVLFVHCNPRREARFFAGAYTTTLKSAHLITSVVPSSCVEIEPTLPICRSVRNLHGFPTVGGYLVQSNIVENIPPDAQLKSLTEPEMLTSSLGWMEFLGLNVHTVTKVEHIMETTFVQDPNVVVTFSVKGCKPSELPDNIIRCDPPPSIRIEEILPTSTVGYSITATTSVLEDALDDNYNGPVVEATETKITNEDDEEKVVEETQPLQHLK